MQLVLYNLRKNEKHVTQEEIANYLGISANAYRAKEKGVRKFSQDEMFALSRYFGKIMDKIFLPRKYQNGMKNN